MKYSIIIPAYNAQEFVIQSVNSILAQTDGDFEILIADDGSKDQTRKIIDAMSDVRIKKHHNDQNLGYLKTCNNLMSLAIGDYIVFQDADDSSLPTRLEEQYKYIKENNLDGCGTWVDRIDDHDNFIEQLHFNENILESLKSRKYDFVENSFMVNRKVIDEVGFYHEYFNRIGFEDFYWTQLIAFKFKIQNLQKSLYLFRDNPNSVTTTFTNYTKEFSFRSVLILLNQKKLGEKDYLELKQIKKLKQEVFEQIIANIDSDKKKSYKLKVVLKCLLNQPFYLKNYKILIRNLF
jgi:glycosyltransferase involved in cell wall biosynthesis